MTRFGAARFGVLACLLSGALFLASLDIGSIGALMLIAPAPLLVYALAAPRWQGAAAAASLARIIAAVGLIWAYHDMLPPVVLALWILGHAFVFALIVVATRWIARTAPVWMTLLAFPLLTTSIEFLFIQVSPHGSFGAIGNALVDVPPLLQLASLGGLPALTFCAGLIAMAIALMMVRPDAWRSLMVIGGAPIILALAFGFWRMSEPYDMQKRIALIALDPISGRAAPDADAAQVAQSYAKAAREHGGGVDFVLLPEAVFKSSPTSSTAAKALQDAAHAIAAPLVAGFDETLGDGQKANTALLFTPDAPPQRYVKRRLIPGLDVGYITGSSPFVVGAIGIAICKDLDFPAMIREYGARGVTLMLAPAWDFGTDGRLHAHMAVLRAVENGFALARAATDGRLTLSDRYGRIVAETVTRGDDVTVLTGEIGLRGGGTLYARIGDGFAGIACAETLALIGNRLAARAARRLKAVSF